MGMFGTNPSEGVLVASDNRAKREQLRVYQARQVLQASKKSRLRKDQWLSIGGALVAVTLASLAVFGYVTLGPGAPAKAPDIAISENREWTGEIMFGDIEVGIVLDGVNAPQATANFVDLATKGFYDGVSCHSLSVEVVFVMQCGDPTGTGTGGPEYRFGPIENAPVDQRYPAGTIAMSRIGNNAESQGSQFFIVYEDSTLPNDEVGGYTVLGGVTSGLEEFVEAYATPGTIDEVPNGAPVVAADIRTITIR
jgi:peptidyl-prolyl cis-trans isomerase B (cyclophilin B)